MNSPKIELSHQSLVALTKQLPPKKRRYALLEFSRVRSQALALLLTVLRNNIQIITMQSFFFSIYLEIDISIFEMELSDSEMKQLVLKLSGKTEQLEAKVTRQKSQNVTLTNEITDLKERVSAQEKYTCKDCIIFYNFPIDATSDDLDIDTCRAIKHHFSYELSRAESLSSSKKAPKYRFERSNNNKIHLLPGQKRNLCLKENAPWFSVQR